MVEVDVRSELPMLRVPISLIVDDWSVTCVSERGDVDYRATYEFLTDMLSLGAAGVRGKISLVPCLTRAADGGHELLGCVSRGVKGVPKEALERTLSLVRGEASRYFDFTPEMLTHTVVVDLDSGELLSETEWEWSQRQGVEELTKYIAQALKVLKDVGIVASGVTSPCDFGREVEGLYAKAVLEAEKLVNGLSLTWYFLHVEPCKARVTPRLMHLDWGLGEAVVSVISCSRDYLGKSELERASGDPSKLADRWLTADGSGGRLAELYRGKSYLVFHTHWYNVYGSGDRLGLKALREVVSRVSRVMGSGVVWMKCSEVARYFATSKAFKAEARGGGREIELVFRSPFACKNFTVSLGVEREVASVEVDGRRLRRLRTVPLEPNSWATSGDRLYACFNLRDGVRLRILLS